MSEQSETNDFTKLAGLMCSCDTETEDDSKNLNVTQMGDALSALADAALTDPLTYHRGWLSALKAAQSRLGK